jgi:hypothetical protein
MADVVEVQPLGDSHAGIRPYTDRSTSIGGVAALIPDASVNDSFVLAEVIAPEISEIALVSTAGFPVSGGAVYLAFSHTAGGVADTQPQPIESYTTANLVPTDASIPVNDITLFTNTTLAPPYWVDIGYADLRHWTTDRVWVTGTAGSDLTLDPSGLIRQAAPAGTVVRLARSKEELLTYTSVKAGNTLSFSPPIVVQYTHHTNESAVVVLVNSSPDPTGFDFALRMPPDLYFRLQSLLDLVRAAGVEVVFINKR